VRTGFSHQVSKETAVDISREIFENQRRPRFGNGNPEKMQYEFWEWMIRGPEENTVIENEGILGRAGLIMRDGILKSTYGPWRARDLFNAPANREDGPIWTFDRDGASMTQLPDGRLICIGGEHEDDYDPDFYIYNDVVVFSPEGQIEVYGYPKEVFPPTDFHTATLVGDLIVIVGCLGHPDQRRVGVTPVFALDVSDYHISELKTSGDMPGWIYKHEAQLAADGTIAIHGGEVLVDTRRGMRCMRSNVNDYAFDLPSRTWRLITKRNWRQFVIQRADGKPLAGDLQEEQILPRGAREVSQTESNDLNESLYNLAGRGAPGPTFQSRPTPDIRYRVSSVQFTVDIQDYWVRVVVEAEVSEERSHRLAEEMRAKTEASIDSLCVLEELDQDDQ
jgi:hypothetical protein